MENLREFELHRPDSLEEALKLSADNPGGRFLGGGTDLVPNMRRGLQDTDHVIDISRIEGLREISNTKEGIVIGAAVTLAELCEHQAILKDYAVLATAASLVAGHSHQAAGTVGGNICQDTRCVFYNQSQWWRQANNYCLKYNGEKCHVAPKTKTCFACYSGDLAPALIVLGAEVELASAKGTRRVALEAIFNDDGAAHLALAPGEMVSAVHVPKGTAKTVYEKVRVRGAIDFPLAGVAVALEKDAGNLKSFRVALTGTNCRPLLIADTDKFLGKPLDEEALAELAKMTQAQVSPMKTTIHTAFYRRRVAGALTAKLAGAMFSA